MRKLWAASAALLVCLALGGMPVLGQDETEPSSAVWVTGTGSIPVEVEAGTETPAGDVLDQGSGLHRRDEDERPACQRDGHGHLEPGPV